VLAMVLAGGQGSRMDVLTEERAKPAMPFAGVYRLIDLPLSNLRNSGISDVWVVAQYEVQSVNDILANGRPWDMDRTRGGLRLITPEQERDAQGAEVMHQGNADAIYKTRKFIREFAPDVLLVLSADHVYRLDYNDVIESHLDRDAEVTVVTTQVPPDQAPNHAVITAGDDDRITAFDYKPVDPATDIVATEVFVYDPEVLLDTLERLADGSADDGSGLEDFGHELLPALVERGKAFAWRLPGYWKDLGRPETYFAAHMDLLGDHPDLRLDESEWPIFTLEHQRMPARFGAEARLDNALISPGCVVHGTVRHAVLGPGVVVEAGATVEYAVVLHDAVIREKAHVQYAILDRRVEVGRGGTVGAAPEGSEVTNDDLVLVGAGAKVDGRRTLRPGDRMSPEGADVELT
jgi:glucose-1-phosphate adenylyltransferase